MLSRDRVNKVQATLKLLRLGLVLGLIIIVLLGIAMAIVGPTVGVGLYQSTLSGIVAAGWHVGPGVALSQWLAASIALCIVVCTTATQLPDQLLASLIMPVCAQLTRWLQAWQVAVLTLAVMVAAMLRDLRTRVVNISPLWLRQVTYCVSAPRAPTAIC